MSENNVTAETPKAKKKADNLTDRAFINAMSVNFHTGLRQAADAGSDTFSFDFETDLGPGSIIVLIRPRPEGVTSAEVGATLLAVLAKGAEVLAKEAEGQG